jgi:glycerol kinase
VKLIAALDQGTTSTRCILFNQSGEIIASAQKEHKQIYPQPGWVEHDPMEILENTKQVISSVLKHKGIPSTSISTIGITNQRETTVIWNKKTGIPYGNAIVWQDTRTDKICAELSASGYQEVFKATTGLPIATYFSGPKIKWLINNFPQIRDDISKNEVYFGNIDTWLIWTLTGGIHGGKHLTDVTNASRTMMMDLHTLSWDKELLDILEIPHEILPKIMPSSNYFGDTVNILSGTPICGDLGDQQAALFGQVCFQPGDAKNTYGTGCFMLLNTGTEIIKSNHGLLTTVGYKIGKQDPVYCLEGSIAITGALVQWLRDNIGIIQSSQEIELLAKTVEDNGGVYFVPAFSGLYAPHWHANARGLIIGLTQYANKGHIARAALEATAYQTFEVLEAMKKDANIDLNLLKVDGGMVRNDLLMQFQADVLEEKVVRPTVIETTALGAAYAAGLEIGFWKSQNELVKNWQMDSMWSPSMNPNKRSALLHNWKKAVKRTYNWVEN